jgi:hypothetical protein
MKQTAVEWLMEQFFSTKRESTVEEIIEQAKEMEKQQQEKFAVGFGEWINNNRINLITHRTEIIWHHSNLEMWITTKELLEIYKKEIGL